MAEPDQDITNKALAPAVAAYLPVTLARHILNGRFLEPGRPYSLNAATMFADISGFTAMSEELASDGTRGAEELNRVLLVTFTAMIDLIHDLGGAVSHFFGDAMAVYFPDEDGQAAERALSCAHMMQRLMVTSFDRVLTNRPMGKQAEFNLTIKIGLGYGRCQEIVVGDPELSMEFVLTGTAVDEATEAEKLASSGQIIASRALLNQTDQVPEADYQEIRLDKVENISAPLLNWEIYDDEALARLIQVAVSYIPRAVYQRLLERGPAQMAEHRPVTSLFVQFHLIGDTDQSSAIDTVQMGQKLQQYYDWAVSVVRRFGSDNGRVNRVLTGDKGNQLHIMFGAPVAPDSPEQALRCAMALIRERPDMIKSQHIGVAVGKVFAGPVGSTKRREYTVVGDVVNLSARLMQICPADTILTSQTTVYRTRQAIEFEALPSQKLKGKQQAITPYKLIDDRATTTQIQTYLDRWQRPLYGRDRETAQLKKQLNEALEGKGSILALTGSTGTGKSRLLAFGIKHWLESGGLGLLGICLQHTGEIPYAPWQSIWRDFFGLSAGMSVDEQINVVVEQTKALAPDLKEDIGLWADPLRLPIPQSETLAALTAEVRQARFFALVRRCFKTAVGKQPIFIIIEGAQYADASSLALLNALVSNIESMALLIGISYRPVNAKQIPFLEHPLIHHIQLLDLSSEYARQILKQVIGTSSLPSAVEQQLGLRDREGRDSPVNPLFLEEALNVMLEVGILEQNGSLHVHEELLSTMQLPDTIHGLLLARLDRLPPAERDLLQIASVIGRQFEIDSLATLAQSPSQSSVLEMLVDLTKADLTRLVTADPEWVYLFQHAMTHEVAYESLPFARRQYLHAQIAGWMLGKYKSDLRPVYSILAFHFSRAKMHQEALEYSLKAANDAKAIFANQEAVELYTLAKTHLQAIGDNDQWETEADILHARAEALRFIGNFDAAVLDAEKAEEITSRNKDDNRYPRILNLLAELKCRQADFKHGEAIALSVIDRLEGKNQSEELARAYQWAGIAASSTGSFSEALVRLEKAKNLSQKINDRERMARVLETTAFVHYQQKDLPRALRAIQQSVDISKDISSPANIAAALSNISLIQFQLGEPNDALNSINQAIEFAQNVSKNFLARSYGNKAEILTYLGKYQAALDSFNEAMALFIAMDDKQGLLEVYLIFGFEYLAANNEIDEFEHYLEKANLLIQQLNLLNSEEEARLHLGYGVFSLMAGKKEASSYLNTAVNIINHRNYLWWKPAAHYYLGQTTLERERAVKQYQAALEAVENEGCPDYLPLILLELAKNSPIEAEKIKYLKKCLITAASRAKFHHKQLCITEAAHLLMQFDDDKLVQFGKRFLQKEKV